MIPVYEEVVRKPNVMKNRNPLKQSKSRIISLEDRMKELQTYKGWQRLIEEYRKQGIIIDPKLRPLIKMVKLKFLFIDEDIQRALENFKATGNPEDELKLLQIIVNSWNFVSEFKPTLICYWREYISKIY